MDNKTKSLFLIIGITLSIALVSPAADIKSSHLSAQSIVKLISIQKTHPAFGGISLHMTRSTIEKKLNKEIKVVRSGEFSCGGYETETIIADQKVSLSFQGEQPEALLRSITVIFPQSLKLAELQTAAKTLNSRIPGLYHRRSQLELKAPEIPNPHIEDGGNTSLYGIPGNESETILLKDSNIYLSEYECVDVD